jgi:hypothetical protein
VSAVARTWARVRGLGACWGATDAERSAPYPCDDLLPDADAPAPLVWRWTCQLRVAPYSYDWIDNLGRRSPPHLIAGLDDVAVGQRAMTIFRVARVDRPRTLTLVHSGPVLGRVAVTYRVEPRAEPGDDPVGCGARLVAKVGARLPGGPFGAVLRTVLPLGDLVMMRKQLLTLRGHAERDAALGAR